MLGGARRNGWAWIVVVFMIAPALPGDLLASAAASPDVDPALAGLPALAESPSRAPSGTPPPLLPLPAPRAAAPVHPLAALARATPAAPAEVAPAASAPAAQLGPLPPPPLVGAAQYVACGTLVGHPRACAPPVAIGAPVLLDLDEDPGAEVAVLLTPLLVPDVADAAADPGGAVPSLVEQMTPPGAGVTLRIGTVAPAAQDALPCNAHATVTPMPHAEAICVFHLQRIHDLLGGDLPTPDDLAAGSLGDPELAASAEVFYRLPAELIGADTDTVIRLGVDGSASKLPETSTVALRITNPLALVAGEARAAYDVTFERPGASAALLVGWQQQDAQGNAIDPTDVRLDFAPVPDLEGTIEAAFDGSHLAATVNPSLTASLVATYDSHQAEPFAVTHVVATVDALPDTTTIGYDAVPGAGDDEPGSVVSLQTSSSIQLLTAAYDRAEAAPLEQHATLALHGLPLEASVEVRSGAGHGTVRYDADGSLGLLETTFAITAEDGVTTTGAASLANLPTRLDAAWDRRTEPSIVTVDADAGYGPLAFTLDTGPGALAMDASIASLPPWLQARFEPGIVEVDGRSGPSDAVGSGPLGWAEVRLATDGALFVSPLAGDHADVHVTATDVRADFAYQGLSYVRADTRDDLVDLETRAAEPRLLAFRVDSPGTFVAGHVDGVPIHMNLLLMPETDVDPTRVTYDAHGTSVPEVGFVLTRGPGDLLADVLLQDLPPYMEAKLGTGIVEVEARASSGAARASDAVGFAHVRFGSDGQLFQSGLPPLATDYADVLSPVAGVQRVDAAYHGLGYLKLTTLGAATHVEAISLEDVVLWVHADLPDAEIVAEIDTVPDHVEVDVDVLAGTFGYASFGEVLERATLFFTTKNSPPLQMSAVVQHMPEELDVSYVFTDDRKFVDFDASQPVGDIELHGCIKGDLAACPALSLHAHAVQVPGTLTFDLVKDGAKQVGTYRASSSVQELLVEMVNENGLFPGVEFRELIAWLVDTPEALDVVIDPSGGMSLDTLGQGSLNAQILVHRTRPIADFLDATNVVHMMTCSPAIPCHPNGATGLEGVWVKTVGLQQLAACMPPDCAVPADAPSGTAEHLRVSATFSGPTDLHFVGTTVESDSGYELIDVRLDDIPAQIGLRIDTGQDTAYDPTEAEVSDSGHVDPTKTRRFTHVQYTGSDGGHLERLRFPVGDDTPAHTKYIEVTDVTMGTGLAFSFLSYENWLCDVDTFGDNDRTDAARIAVGASGPWHVGRVLVMLPDGDEGTYVQLDDVGLHPDGDAGFASDNFVCMAIDECCVSPAFPTGKDVPNGIASVGVGTGGLSGALKVGSLDEGSREDPDVWFHFCHAPTGWNGSFGVEVEDSAGAIPPTKLVFPVNTNYGDFGIRFPFPMDNHAGCDI